MTGHVTIFSECAEKDLKLPYKFTGKRTSVNSKHLKLMGILNVTPDSFFDGGKFNRIDRALIQAEKMAEEGADFLDVGGESTRPGALPVSASEECQRVVPVVKMLVRRFPKIPVSIDTQKSEVAYQCLHAGARIVNDVSALRADESSMLNTIKKFDARVVLMHMLRSPQTMQKSPRYQAVVREVKKFLSDRINWAVRNGIAREKIWIDPGIGFGKTVKHNLQLLNRLKDYLSLRCPLLVGSSRKSFIGKVLMPEDPLLPEDRLEGSLAAACWSFLQGVSILRVHDVGATRKAVGVMEAIKTADGFI